MLGGTQSLHTNSYDEAIALPTEKAARLALRTQQVLAYETDLTATVDPFAGSYVVEAMTDEVEAAAVGADGAGRRARRGGRRRSRPASRSARSRRRPTRSRRRSTPASGWWSGVNRFTLAEEEPYEPLRVDPAIEAEQTDRLPTLRAERDRRAVDAGAGRAADGRRGHRQRAATPMREALRARATVGEVCDTLRDVWGLYRPVARSVRRPLFQRTNRVGTARTGAY